MTAELIRELGRIQRYATGLRDLLAQAQAQAPPRAEGTDRSGAVWVVLGPDGLPETIGVQSGWSRRLAPEQFGSAVGEACSAATGDRLAAWTTALREHGWPAAVDRLRADVDREAMSSSGSGPGPGHGSVPESNAVPPALRRPPRPPRTRPLNAVAEDVIRAFDSVDQLTAAPPMPGSGAGSAASGRLSLTLSASGELSCAADPDWVSRQSAASLMTALSAALLAARADLDRADPDRNAESANSAKPANDAARLDGLLGEAFALLTNPLTTISGS